MGVQMSTVVNFKKMIGFRKVYKPDSELEKNLMLDRKLMSNFS